MDPKKSEIRVRLGKNGVILYEDTGEEAEKTEDSEIIRLLTERNESGLEEAQRKYGAYCRRTAYNVLGDECDAEECVNDALMRLWLSVPPNTPENLRGYLSVLTRNLALNRLRDRHRARRFGGEADIALDELGETLPDPADEEAEQRAERLGKSIDTFLRTLSVRDRGVFVLRYYHFVPLSDIALKYGMKENRLRSLLSRIRAKLKAYLKKEGFEI